MPNFRQGFDQSVQTSGRERDTRICQECFIRDAEPYSYWCPQCNEDFDEWEFLNDRYADWGGVGPFDEWHDAIR